MDTDFILSRCAGGQILVAGRVFQELLKYASSFLYFMQQQRVNHKENLGLLNILTLQRGDLHLNRRRSDMSHYP